MIEINTEINCCGIGEIVDIIENENHPEITVLDICKEMYENDKRSAFLIFSDIGRKKGGINLKRYIKKHNLGTVTASPTAINSNSGNSLRMWIWTINKRNLRNYYIKHTNRNIYD